MGRYLCVLIATLVGLEAHALEGRYRIEGVGPGAAYVGSGRIWSAGDDVRVSFRLFEGGAERRATGVTRAAGGGLALSLRIDSRPGSAGRAQGRAVPLAGGGLKVSYRDGDLLRHEVWTRDDALARVPVVVVALGGPGGVTPVQARAAQRWILAQLNAVYGDLGVAFHALLSAPRELPAKEFDLDEDGTYSRDEVRALRGALEEQRLKSPGRVVLAVTSADFVHGDCRGWTLGDAPPTPGTLTDPNDNFSLVGLSYLDPSEFHTVAHEVGHQLGLDDLRPANRHLLEEPRRSDHLMISGGRGLHLDRETRRIVRSGVTRFPNHGLDGRRARRVPLPAPRPTGSAGLPELPRCRSLD